MAVAVDQIPFVDLRTVQIFNFVIREKFLHLFIYLRFFNVFEDF